MTHETLTKTSVEDRLQELVDEWISYGTWRRDYAVYRRQMFHSENHQGGKVDLLERSAQELKVKHVLDLGCGAGGFSVALARKGYHVIPCDLNLTCCEMTMLRGLRHDLRLSPVSASAHSLPFDDRAFNVVACYDVLEHVGDPLASLREVRRVMSDNGICVVNFHHRFTMRDPHFRMNFVNWLPMSVAEWWIDRKGRGPRGRGHLTAECGQRLSEMHYFTCRAFRRLCETARMECRILPPDHDGKPLPIKHRLRPFMNQYAAILKRDNG